MAEYGICHICGEYKKLSYEHVPPETAFNNCRVKGWHPLNLINVSPQDYDTQKYEQFQKGAGAYTLCERCNNTTGKWYGDAFGWFARQGLENLRVKGDAVHLYHVFRIFPLRVIKQIVTMFFSVRGRDLHKKQPDLVKFVLDKRGRYLNPDVRIYAYLNLGPHGRFMGDVVKCTLNPDEITPDTLADMTASANCCMRLGHTINEIGFWPFGFVMDYGSEAPHPKAVDISYFSHYGYFDWEPLALGLPRLPVHTMYLGDYRTLAEIERHASETERVT